MNDGVHVHLHGVGAVFQGVLHRHRVVGQLALLAQRHEAGGELVGDCGAEDEAPRLDPGHLVAPFACEGRHHLGHRPAKGARVAQQGGDVAEHDPGPGVIRDGADGVA